MKQIKSINAGYMIEKVWGNKRHVFVPILHCKIIPGLKGTVIKRQICW